jgi:hypothetical protein
MRQYPSAFSWYRLSPSPQDFLRKLAGITSQVFHQSVSSDHLHGFLDEGAFNINLYGHRLAIGLKGFRGLSRGLLRDGSHHAASPHRPHISHLLSTFTNPQIPYMTPREDLLQGRVPDYLMSLRPRGLKTVVAGDGGNSP